MRHVLLHINSFESITKLLNIMTLCTAVKQDFANLLHFALHLDHHHDKYSTALQVLC